MIVKLASVALTALISVVVLFLLTKLLGNKQISQLSMFDYIIGISIGSIAAEMATELEEPLQPLIAMTIYAFLAFLIAVVSRKSLGARKILSGRPLMLMHAGEIYRKNLVKARFDLSDFLTLCRAAGYFDLRDIETAVLEENGTVSFLPRESARPATPRDLNLYPKQREVLMPVVLDGCIMPKNLTGAGRTEEWLMRELKILGYGGPADVLLAAVDGEGALFAFPLRSKAPPAG